MRLHILISLAIVLAWTVAARGGEAPKRVKVQLNDGRVVEGVLVDKSAKMMTVKEVGGHLRAFPAADVKKLEYVTVKLPSAKEVAAAFAKEAGPLLAQKTRGKVIKFSGARIYGNCGKRDGIAVGMTFTVNEEGEKLVDPDTGEELGSERKLIGRVKVIEVQDKFFKAVHIGDTEPSYKAGQVVELEGASNAVAVFPFVIEGKNLKYTVLSDLILESLIAAKVKVVERELLAAALVEQGISNTFLADPATAQKMGKIVGARHIVTGIARPGATNTIQVRLINVATAGIAMAKTYELGEAIVPDGTTARQPGQPLTPAPVTPAPPSRPGTPSVGADAKPFGGHWYKFFPEGRGRISWKEAKGRCEAAGGYLAVITSDQENKFVSGLAGGKRTWLGGTDEDTEGRWRWVNGERFVYSKWARNEPSGDAGKGHYMMLYRGTWNDSILRDGNVAGFVCEWNARPR